MMYEMCRLDHVYGYHDATSNATMPLSDSRKAQSLQRFEEWLWRRSLGSPFRQVDHFARDPQGGEQVVNKTCLRALFNKYDETTVCMTESDQRFHNYLSVELVVWAALSIILEPLGTCGQIHLTIWAL
jgi:hypothetical protein